MNIRITSKGVVEAIGRTKEIKRRLKNLQPVLSVGAIDINTLMADSFRLESSPGGNAWAGLADSTIENRVRRGKAAKRRNKKGELTKGATELREKRRGNLKILQGLTVRLKNSLFARATNNKITFGSNVVYLAPHQLGSDNAGRSHNVVIPERPVAPVEKRGANWSLMHRGRAVLVFNNLQKAIIDYVGAA